MADSYLLCVEQTFYNQTFNQGDTCLPLQETDVGNLLFGFLFCFLGRLVLQERSFGWTAVLTAVLVLL